MNAMNTVVEMAAVTRTYGRRVLALNHLDLSVPVGGVFGLIGPNGCCKTTTLRVLLGLARPDSGDVTMLGDPDLLILDEPANGLDPAGIAAMREMLSTFGATGRTVLVSSHHLTDVERICDRVAVVVNGSTVATGTIDEIAGHRRDVQLIVRKYDRAAAVLADAGYPVQRGSGPGALLVSGADGESVARMLGAADIYPSELRTATDLSIRTPHGHRWARGGLPSPHRGGSARRWPRRHRR